MQGSMKDWRPIALCSVLYKLVSKVLANRLKKILHKCIAETQSAFVPGISILDNALVAIELVHYMKTNIRRKDKNVALKLDISKAYDRIDWAYLKDVMRKMGFANRWVDWIMMCVETVDYSVIVNKDIVGPIIPSRGLRQGDPLSPYLFILCAEGLSALIRDAETKGELQGVRICRNAPVVSHLFFADDCFLFFQAEESQAQVMKRILNTYEEASGQAISLPKSEIFYSRNVQQQLQQNITHILGVQAVLGTGKYLGLPSMVGRSKKATFNFIKDRVWQRINSWSSKCLSRSGREVMIKSVLQSILSYVMSIFKLPNSLLDEIEKMMNAFWWGHGGANNKGLHWLSWDKLSIHKRYGGMGFKDLAAFNVAMLGKQGWKFQTEPDTLVSKVFKARYFPRSNYLGSTLGHNPSFVWRSIFSAKLVVRHGARWMVGSGYGIPIIDEPWLSGGSRVALISPAAQSLQGYSVGHLIHQGIKNWNEELVRYIFEDGTAQQILNTSLFQQVSEDRLVWQPEKNGKYSVRSAYRVCMEEISDNSHLKRSGYWSGIWKLKVPPKVKSFVWRVCRECLPTRVRLNRRGVTCPSSCVKCNDPHEDSYHVFFHCGTTV